VAPTGRSRGGEVADESGTKWGRLHCERYGVQCPAEAWVPAVEVASELVVEDAGADLEQEVGAAGCPAHLLFLDHAFGDDLVDRGLCERGGDGLASTVAFPVVGDPVGVDADVTVELADRFEQPGLLRAVPGDVELEPVPAQPGCDLDAGLDRLAGWRWVTVIFVSGSPSVTDKIKSRGHRPGRVTVM
jgi:hypothetical protein